MTPERRQILVRRIGWIYFASFWLPVSPIAPFGGWVCLATLIDGVLLVLPALLMAWSANPLFVLGLTALRARRIRWAAGYGVAALIASLPAIPYTAEPIGNAIANTDGVQLLFLSGYFAWMLALIALAVVGTLATVKELPEGVRVRFRLGQGMVAIALIGVALAIWPSFIRVLYTSWR